MLSVRAGQAMLLIATLAVTPAFAAVSHSASTSGHSRTVSAHKGRHLKASKVHGQRVIDSARATQIQTALISQKYLSGSPSGQWDAQTEAAMQKYQADHGWQTKLMPDSRALISLGLGPNHAEGTAVATPGSSAPATQSQQTEPAANTLASVHSISQ